MALNPANDSQHIQRTITGYAKDDREKVTPVTSYMWEAQWGNRKGFAFKKWHLCVVCNRLYPEGKIQKYKGKWLCLLRNHYRDAVEDGN